MEAGNDNQLTKKRLCKDTSAEAGLYCDFCVPVELTVSFTKAFEPVRVIAG
jgi:hypothetical protein